MTEPATKRTDRLGIVIENHPYDRGYWHRFNGYPITFCCSQDERMGWHDCNNDLRFEKANSEPSL